MCIIHKAVAVACSSHWAETSPTPCIFKIHANANLLKSCILTWLVCCSFWHLDQELKQWSELMRNWTSSDISRHIWKAEKILTHSKVWDASGLRATALSHDPKFGWKGGICYIQYIAFGNCNTWQMGYWIQFYSFILKELFNQKLKLYHWKS